MLYTGHNLQLVLMSIKPGEEIGEEVHDDRDQFFRIEAGEFEIHATPASLEAMTKNDLMALAKERGIRFDPADKKEVILALLTKDEQAA